MHHKIDNMHLVDNKIKIEGWVLPDDLSDNITYKILDNNKQEISYEFEHINRVDVLDFYNIKNNDNYDAGFNIEFDVVDDRFYFLYIISNKKIKKIKLSKEIVNNFNSIEYKNKMKFVNFFSKNTFKRAFEYLMTEGLFNFLDKTKRKLKSLTAEYDYDEWYNLTKPNDEQLKIQSQNINNDFSYLPKFSFVIPIYDTKDKFLIKLFDSILNQTYQNFEICIADATDYHDNTNNPKRFFEKLNNPKIKIKYLNQNTSIATNTNEALKLATGDYIILCDHDDEITLDALYEIAKAINNNQNLKFIYSDEDKIDTTSSYYFEPHFKPDFNLDMLLSVNYICHLSCIKKSIVDDIINIYGQFERSEYNGAQDYDLFLRLVNLLNDKNELNNIFHIRKVLYHWRSHNLSTSKVASSKDYAFLSGKKAIMDFYKNTNFDFKNVLDVENGYSIGLYHTVYKKIDKNNNLDIIIPNKDHIEDLEKCLNSLKKSSFKNFFVYIVENNSTDERTFEYYKQIKNQFDFDINILYYDNIFNYLKINNFGVNNSKSDYILFLNNDIEMINDNSIEEMLNFIKRDDVGIVGSKLLYPDDTVQHGGVIMGFGGIAGHAFATVSEKRTYMNRVQMVQDLNAVTAACMMTKRDLFNKVNGFSENLVVAFNDIDYCMKIRELNKLVVYNPYSSFYHYESKTRGYEDTKEKIERFNREIAIFNKKWGDKIIKGDEYYNPNLTLMQTNFSLRNLKKEKIGEPYKLDDEIMRIMESLDE